MAKRFFLTFLVALLIVTECLAWGQVGHDTTCSIAENHLSRKAKKKIKKILDGKSIIYWANWLDNASHQPEYRYSSTWHYKDVTPGVEYKDMEPAEKGDIVTALTEQIQKLKSHNLPEEEEALALKMVIHLMGDLHQPMHLGRTTDLGGNKYKVNFFKEQTNLHHVWDEDIIESGHRWTYDEWTKQIDRAEKNEMKKIVEGDIDSWAYDTYTLSQQVYAATPENSTISYDYIAKWTPAIEQQLLKGGLRLAHILNEIYN